MPPVAPEGGVAVRIQGVSHGKGVLRCDGAETVSGAGLG